MNNKLIGTISIVLIITFIFSGSTGTENININDIKDPDLKFVVIGDPHIKAIDNNDSGAERLRSIVETVNNMDVDFVVIMGDITNNGTRKQYELSKNILSDLKKPYYIVIGNHDMKTSDNLFEEYYGSPEKIETVKNRNTGDIYQLLFVGTYADRDGITNISWSFDFNKTNKTIPTFVFAHTPIRCPSNVYISCKLRENDLVYGKGMEQELDKFVNLLGVYSGHIHRDSNEIINGVRFVTIDGLVSIGIGGIYAKASDDIGYSVVKDGVLYYQLIPYN